MISLIVVKKVELGPRQMTFGFEDRMSKNLDSVFSFIEKAYQTGGPVALDDLISSPQLLDELAAPEILQIIFWLAEELKIHFFARDQIFSPLKTKKMLMENPGNPVFVVINRQVDGRKFRQAQKIGRSVLSTLPEGDDQYIFSRYLVGKLKTWQASLTSFAIQAKQPFFPGSKDINNGIVLLDKILEKQDSYSMILACLKYQSRIVKLAETVTVLTPFYDQDQSFWQVFVDQMQAFEINLTEIKKDKHIFSKFCRLNEIMTSPYPYPLVTEAERLLTDVQDFHKQVEQKKMAVQRSNALVTTEKMIRKLIGLFDTFESDQEYRNNCLYELRTLSKRIEKTHHIEEINTLLDDVKDFFVDVIEDI
ncbi:hypothetical protein [Desulfobacula sp.]|uniref:hypothetical protein n=1 Tax=Desulfobacula sp. TaxID=2593537 RepID=UPI002624BEDE|nr:hypothetical protein [Desulfobacula sp.]